MARHYFITDHTARNGYLWALWSQEEAGHDVRVEGHFATRNAAVVEAAKLGKLIMSPDPYPMWWARVRTGQCSVDFGPYESRERAVAEGWPHASKSAREISTGYGKFSPCFDIRWHKREV